MSATNSTTSTLTFPSEREIAMTRVFNAPRELVFRAYTDPKLVSQWWGQRNSTTTVDKMDVRVGGIWRYVQRDPAGIEYGFNGEYREIVPPERLVSTFEFEGLPGHIVVDSAVFEQLPDVKTKLTVTSLFTSVEDRDRMMQSGMEDGANETWDRLAELLAKG